MRILLPPSETKRPGGGGAPLSLADLALPALTAQREQTISALASLADDPVRAASVLKLSERQLGDIDDNRRFRQSATMPAVDRYTGVLFDALDAASLDAAARRWLGAHVWIHSAPLGPVGALDPIPAYRLAAGTSLPDLRPLRALWAQSVTAALEAEAPWFLLDMRSEAYVRLGPVPASTSSRYLRVVTAQGRALNHFNKKAKGELVRRLAEARPRVDSLRALVRWAADAGVLLREGDDPGTVELIVAA